MSSRRNGPVNARHDMMGLETPNLSEPIDVSIEKVVKPKKAKSPKKTKDVKAPREKAAENNVARKNEDGMSI